MRHARLPTLVLLLAAACGDDAPEPPPLVWSWVPIEGAVCGDGSATGIGIERGVGEAPDVLVFLMGGGACWEALTCFPPAPAPALATPGPFGAAELDATLQARRAGSVLDRAAPGNPYKDFTFVFVPYCTGDVHAGDVVQDYLYAPRRWHHKGRLNVEKAFERLAALLAAPRKVVVSGSSAGGFGALFAFQRAKEAWPDAKAYLVDDSGPPLANIPAATVAAWVLAWNLEPVLTPLCGRACATDLSRTLPALAARYPSDRFALLSSTADEVMTGFFGALSLSPPYLDPMSPADFERGLRSLVEEIEDDVPPGESHAFVVPGTTHPMLDRPGEFSSQDVPLFEWLRRMLADEPGWASAIPP
jgi:hypothetical protein